MGGSLFTLLTMYGQVLPFVALSFYSTSTTVENKSNPHEMNIVLIVLACCWGVSVLTFFGLVDRDKWCTFFWTITGAQDTVKTFRSSDNPAIKMNAIFTNHSSFTESIKDEVIAYMHDKWAEWVRTQPAWFTPKFIASVGDEFIPERALRRLSETAIEAGNLGRERRKILTLSSMKEVVITLTTVDTMTDVYMIYLYKVNGLHSNANKMVAMISFNTVFQLILVLVTYKKKGWRTVLKEGLVTLLFTRPFVDAWRVHNKHDDSETNLDPLHTMLMNKGIELASESIPGCVLQCYVLLMNPGLGSSR